MTDSSDPQRPEAKPKSPFRQRADALHQQGMPFQMAMAVATGRMDMSEALARLEVEREVEVMMAEHDLERAIAVQIAKGGAELDTVLFGRRYQAHRTVGRERTTLVEGAELTLGCHATKPVTGVITELLPYAIRFAVRDGDELEIRKLDVLYTYVPSDWKRARKAIRTDKAVARKGLKPQPKPQDRYGISDKRLFRYLDQQREIAVTLVDGQHIRGTIPWFARYEFGLQVRGDVVIGIFRHALVNVESLG